MSEMVCPTCRGKGWFKERNYLNGQWVQESVCETCKGKGKIPVAEPKTHFEEFTQDAETLAKWLRVGMKCECCPQQDRCNGYHGGCGDVLLEWLNQEVSDDDKK